ncbi:uncharacterized protein Z519_02243 [Cladophialophora bantiana CBS 173.52]|uniref:FAD/NAD(P)-binding domain-containing protein n=1 Tax=Cladophialophora bantiana (strain ATCC 10958 / CBS 173.52 / CDC B-1940 / NIH 8579) TaxID=1442370 RepID=A0A0D2GEQ9_CLAB1|nr:uncharacterized protein Z519_02243 [Cladophialophora bantiana CBS 173.52]KIW96852.1 hypothetical protein Z519_02243 [Cladophialophora bantiana CBS 173.52]
MSAPTRVIIIGAGLAGLVAAKTYLQVCNHLERPLDLIVLDEAKNPGGVWTTERHYPGLTVQAPNGYYELSDFSMVDADHPWNSLIPAAREQAYLESYARRFDVYDKIRFSATVVKVYKRKAPSQPGWSVETASGEVLECDKLIVASGLYSKPRPIPIFDSAYTGTAVHSRDLGRMHENISKDATVKDVVVIGGCKSAVEACSVFLASNKRVHWIIRPSDQGAPLIISHPDAKPNPLALAVTRLFPIFSPSIWSTSGFWYCFLHSGRWILGTWIVQGFLNLMSWAITREIHYGKSRNSAKIQPKGKSMFFYATYLSLIVEGHPFFDALHEDNPDKLTVYRATPLRCEGREIVVDEEDRGQRRLPADAIIWSIGWEPGVDFFEPEEAAEIGLPVPLHRIRNKNKTLSASTKGAVPIPSPVAPSDSALPPLEFYDGKIRKLFPGTLNQTPFQRQDPTSTISHTRWGLYRFIIPSSHFARDDRTLAFAGFISSAQTAATSEIGALWAVAWLENLFARVPMPLLDRVDADRLTIPPPLSTSKPRREELRKHGRGAEDLKLLADAEIRFNQAFQERRYGFRGARAPELILEARGYIDVLCRDLGVESQRKRYRMRERHGGALPMEETGWWNAIKNWFREFFEPYIATDFQGVVEEFLRNRESALQEKDD